MTLLSDAEIAEIRRKAADGYEPQSQRWWW
jgi:hypothetical protein